MDLVSFLLVGLLAGFLVGKFVKGSGFGLVGNLIVGGVGAILGGWVFGLLGFRTSGGLLPSLIVASVGALLFLWLLGKFGRARR